MSPSECYYGLIFPERLGSVAFAFKLRAEHLRNLGPTLNRFGALFLPMGLETFSLRSRRYCDNTLALATYVGSIFSHLHPALTPLCTPVGLRSTPRSHGHRYHERAKELLRPNAYGGVLSFGVKGDLATASKVVLDTHRLASNPANVDDAKTVIIHPASTTHE